MKQLKALFLFVYLFGFLGIEEMNAQSQSSSCEKPPQRTGLPFRIDSEKQLCIKDLIKKKEGWFPTGLPLLNSDPNTGIGYGVRLYVYNNGSKSDPFFDYTPYRFKMYVQYFNTTKNRQNQNITFDAPFIFDTQWRLRGEAAYDANPNSLFFGVGESTLQGLSYRERNQEGGNLFSNSTFEDQQTNLSYMRPGGPDDPVMLNGAVYSGFSSGPGFRVTDSLHNRYNIITPSFQTSAERSYFGGVFRLVAGIKLSQNIIKTFDGVITNGRDPLYDGTPFPTNGRAINGRTKLTEAQESGTILGYHGGVVNAGRVGIVYDTRDFEPDPNNGVFWELTYENSGKLVGSEYSYSKYFTQFKYFYSLLPKTFDKLVLAGRGAFSFTEGNTPFFEYRNMWGTEGTITGLGGDNTLRGYKADRFIGKAMGWGNLEIRWRFFQFSAFSQNFTLSAVPFMDFGRIWDDEHKANFKGYKHSNGLGLRIAWNQSTIITIDYAVSKEDKQLFVNFNHAF
ncbi:Omp85 family outer membrane protein [Leptospira andrefontaineae]|uniref:Peptide-binding protein n=1 Tax=Leptospira andrefontaineae TaxID=2484976 RepID=A0A4R9HCG6_9LEPT|nr:DUF5982 domain-containing protein [Leptospira andrefontaineae]TGK44492.1 peptide-binding protein [Leptospira andrefontaineae]